MYTQSLWQHRPRVLWNPIGHVCTGLLHLQAGIVMPVWDTFATVVQAAVDHVAHMVSLAWRQPPERNKNENVIPQRRV